MVQADLSDQVPSFQAPVQSSQAQLGASMAMDPFIKTAQPPTNSPMESRQMTTMAQLNLDTKSKEMATPLQASTMLTCQDTVPNLTLTLSGQLTDLLMAQDQFCNSALMNYSFESF